MVWRGWLDKCKPDNLVTQIRKQAAREAISVTMNLALKKKKNEIAPIEVADAIWAHFGLGES